MANEINGRHVYRPTWQDRELRFDAKIVDLKLRRGEEEIDSINSVEDSKGNNGDRGFLVITNLRLIWVSHKRPRTNLSVGLNSIVKLSIKTANSRLRGSIQACKLECCWLFVVISCTVLISMISMISKSSPCHLHCFQKSVTLSPTHAVFVMCKYKKSRYEFIFTSLVRKSPRLFTTAQAVFRAYETTRLYRDLKLRGALLQNKNLVLLPLEKIYEKVNGVWNLSNDQGNLGTFYITNVRLVWHANLAENFNVSIPYLQMLRLVTRKSKFGKALVVHTHKNAGGYILGFRIDPVELLERIFQQIQVLRKNFASKPIYGIEFKLDTDEHSTSSLEKFRVERKEDELEIIEDDAPSMSFGSAAMKYGDGVGNMNEESGDRPVFNKTLGLAMEPLSDGVDGAKELWQLYA